MLFHVIINLELYSILAKFNSFRFEKHFGGKYLGEIVRCILVRLTKEGLLFEGKASAELLSHGAFTTRYVSLIDE